MNCTCGYSFSSLTAIGKREHRSFIVVDDEHYLTFLRHECKVMAKGLSRTKKRRALAEAAAYAGWLGVCPQCERITISLPQGNAKVTYAKETT